MAKSSQTSPNLSLQVRRKALEPSSIDKLPREERWRPSDEAQTKDVFPDTMQAPLMYRHPDWFMRQMGFHANPMYCTHHRRRFKTRWVCMDCGKELC